MITSTWLQHWTSQHSPENQSEQNTYIERFIIEIGSCHYGDQKVPLSAICKLKNQKSCWCNSVQVQKPKKQGHRCPRTGEDGCRISRREGDFSLLFSFYFIQAIHRLEDTTAYSNTCEGYIFTQFTESNGNLCSNTPTNTPRSKVLPGTWAFLSWVNLAHEINHHR